MAQPQQLPRDGEVIIGRPVAIPYSRAFPLLDGLFQDISAIQLDQLKLDANVPNASRIDSLMEQFSANLQFSQALGIQNNIAAQQTQMTSQRMAFDQQLMQQELALYPLITQAIQAVADAKTAKAALAANASDDDKRLADQRVATAEANLAMIRSNLDTIKALRVQYTAPSFSGPSPSPLPVPTAMSNPSFPDTKGDKKTVSFPASKQMENHINLLWERLAHLVNNLASAQQEGDIYLVRFETGIYADQKYRKKQLLTTRYRLACADNAEPGVVLDLFPRLAAINVADQKYRNSRFGLGALLSFFSVGINAAYNREHLRASQSLGQSGYVTGWGIQSDSFGWIYARSLGDDAISPGPRATYALVSFPRDCSDARIEAVQSVWGKSPTTAALTDVENRDGNEAIKTGGFDKEALTASLRPAITIPRWTEGKKLTFVNRGTLETISRASTYSCVDDRSRSCVEHIAYAVKEFDTAEEKVTISIKLNERLDREQLVSVDGNAIKRSRDSFGRGTASNGTATTVSGFLQSAQQEAGTWFPINEHELTITLDARKYDKRFPRIILSSPNGLIDLSDTTRSGAKVLVNGMEYFCSGQCVSTLPPIGRRRATLKKFHGWRRVISQETRDLYFKVRDEPATPQSPAPAANSLSGLRVNRGAEAEPWSPDAFVIATQTVGTSKQSFPLDCSPFYEYLRCKDPSNGFSVNSAATFAIYDADYSGTPVQGEVELPDCWIDTRDRGRRGWTPCKDPLVLSMTPPKWSDPDNGWKFTMTLVNVSKNGFAYLDGIRSKPIKCSDDWNLPCSAEFVITLPDFDRTQDSMTFKALGDDDATQIGETSEILNLRQQISPYITSIEGDHAGFTGINLAFTEVQLNQNPKNRRIPLNCSGPIGGKRKCSIELKKDEHGFLFFRTLAGEHIPFMKIESNGSIEPVAEHKRNEPEPNKTAEQPSRQPASEKTFVNIIQNTSPLLIRKDQ